MSKKTGVRKRLKAKDPREIADNSGATYENGEIRLKLIGRQLRVRLPECEVVGSSCEVKDHLSELILNYLYRTEEPAGADEWIAFREIPHGQFYSDNFKKNTEIKLTRTFQSEIDDFERVAAELGGEEIEIGDSGFAFRVLPKFRLALVFWSGGDEFQDKINVLFEETATDCLSTEGLSILGKEFCNRFIETAEEEG